MFTFQGLILEIQNALATAQLDSYIEIVDIAQRVEDSLTKLREYQKVPKN